MIASVIFRNEQFAAELVSLEVMFKHCNLLYQSCQNLYRLVLFLLKMPKLTKSNIKLCSFIPIRVLRIKSSKLMRDNLRDNSQWRMVTKFPLKCCHLSFVNLILLLSVGITLRGNPNNTADDKYLFHSGLFYIRLILGAIFESLEKVKEV